MLRKFIGFLFLVILNVSYASVFDIDYAIEFNDKMQCIDIKSTIPTNQNNELIISIPQRGVSSLEIKPHFIRSMDVSPFIKKILFAAPTLATIQYQLCMNNQKHHIDLP